jgi:hypothetical protein
MPSVKTSSNKKVNNKDELFDYLAYHGVKNVKAMELEKKKTEEELASCTFKPTIIKYKKDTPSKAANSAIGDQGSAR